MRTIKINPHDRSITEVELPTERGNSRAFLDACYAEVGHGCDLIEIVNCGRPTLTHNVALVVDEEGLLKPNAGWRFKGYPHRDPFGYVLMGTGLLMTSDRQGNMTALPGDITLDTVKEWVQWQ
jgi:hypothetical protein